MQTLRTKYSTIFSGAHRICRPSRIFSRRCRNSCCANTRRLRQRPALPRVRASPNRLARWRELRRAMVTARARFPLICQFGVQYQKSVGTNRAPAAAGKNTRTAAGEWRELWRRSPRRAPALLSALPQTPLHLVRRNLQLVTIRIAEIDRVRDLVVLEFKFDSAVFQFALCSEKIFPARTKREVKHANFAVIYGLRLMGGREQGDSSISFANESRHTVPHPFVKAIKSENFDVPLGRSLDVTHAHRYMINSLKPHRHRTYRIDRVE